MTINTSPIPAGNAIRVPLFYVAFDNSQAAVSDTQASKVLLLGQTLNQLPLQLSEAISVGTVQAATGRGSYIDRMFRTYRLADAASEVWFLPVPDGTGAAAATQILTFLGAVTATSTLALYIAGQPVPVLTLIGTTAAQVATLVAAAVNAALDLPVTAAVIGTGNQSVTLTARHVGALGNAIDVRINYRGLRNGESTPPGLTVALNSPMTGTQDPDLTGVGAIIGDLQFDAIVCPYSSSAALAAMTVMMSFAAGRWSYSRQSYGHVWSAVAGVSTATLPAAAELQAVGAGLNDPHLTVVGYYDSPTPPWEFVADRVATSFPSLSADPGQPTQTLQQTSALAPPASSRFPFAVQNSLLSNGIALSSYDDAGNVYVLRDTTTYQSNAFGTSDLSYTDTETMYLLMEVTRRLKAAVTTKFSRVKIVNDGTAFGPGQPMVTPKMIKAELVAEYASMEDDGLVEDTAVFTAGLKVERDSSNPSRVNILYDPYLVSGLRIFAVLNQFRLLDPALAA